MKNLADLVDLVDLADLADMCPTMVFSILSSLILCMGPNDGVPAILHSK